MTSHNARQKALFRHRAVFASLLRGFGHVLGLSPELMARIDFENIELAGTEFISAEMRERRADLLWKVPLLTLPGEVGPPLPPCFVHTELQSSSEADMLLRMEEYALLIEQAIERAGEGRRRPGAAHSAVLSTVLYTGEGDWTAPTDRTSWHGTSLFETSTGNSRYHVLNIWSYPLDELPEDELVSCWIRLERAETIDEMQGAVADAFRLAPGPEHGRLRRTFWRVWMKSPLWGGKVGRPSFRAFETSIPGGGTMPSLLEINGRRLRDQWIGEGLEQGRSEGLEQGLERHRAMLSHQAVRRFGNEMSERLSASLARIHNFDRLDEVEEWIVDCGTGEELLSRFTRFNGSG